MTPLLRTQGLSVSYGGVKALIDVDLEVAEGQLVGLIGPNGAGKTTFIDAVSGFAPARGTVELAGVGIQGLPAHERATRGLGRTWQTADVYEELSVRENLAIAADRPRGWDAIRELLSGQRRASSQVDETLSLLGISELADMQPDELSQGQRKLVDVARAIAGRPKVLCLDEPAAGLDTSETGVLAGHLRDVVAAGITLLLVDHDMSLVLGVCDHVVVLDFGQVIASGTPAQIRADDAVIRAYLGTEAADETDAAGDTPTSPLLGGPR